MQKTTARSVWTIGYSLCCAIAGAGIVWLTASIGLAACTQGGVDEEILLLGLPLGAVVGWIVARRTRQLAALHRFLRCVGAVAAVLAISVGAWSFDRATALSGTGMFAGLGELVIAVVAAAVAAIGVVLVLAGVCGRLALRASSVERGLDVAAP